MTDDKPAREPFDFFESPWFKDATSQLCADGWPMFIVPLNIAIRECKTAYDKLKHSYNELLDNESKMNGALSAKQEIIDTLKAENEAMEFKLNGDQQERVNKLFDQTDEITRLQSRITRLESALDLVTTFHDGVSKISIADARNVLEGDAR